MTGECEWRHAPEACAEDLGRFEKSQLVEIETWARPDEFVRYGRRTCWGWTDGKVSIERWYLSPYVEKPFNSKVIKKSFVPELRSRKCFLCFGIPMFYVYELRTFYVHFTYSCMAMLQIHFNSSVCWLEIRIRLHRVHIGTFFYITTCNHFTVCKHMINSQ